MKRTKRTEEEWFFIVIYVMLVSFAMGVIAGWVFCYESNEYKWLIKAANQRRNT